MESLASNRRRWQPFEDDFLRLVYRYESSHLIARTLGRSQQAVKTRARVIGVSYRLLPGQSLVDLKYQLHRDKCLLDGWPQDVTGNELRVLKSLWEYGPMSLRDISKATGIPIKNRRLESGMGKGSHTANLIAKGYVIRVYNGAKLLGDPQPTQSDLYLLSPQFRRSKAK